MTKKNLLMFSLATITITLSACGDKQETYTSDYLYANDDVRAKVLADCKENKQTPENCQNANQAEDTKKLEEYRKRTNR